MRAWARKSAFQLLRIGGLLHRSSVLAAAAGAALATGRAGIVPAPIAPPTASARGATGDAGVYSAAKWRAFALRNGPPFDARVAALLCPGPLFGFPLLAPSLKLSRSYLQSFDGQRLRHHCWRFIAAGWPGPPGSRAISLSFQGAGRLHVNVGWRHPRPVAANDGPIVSGSRTAPGIASGQSARPLGEQIANAHAGAATGTGDPAHAKMLWQVG